MGNTGMAKIFFNLDNVETRYQTIHDIQFMNIQRQFQSIPKDQICLIVNIASDNSQAQSQIKQLNELKNKFKDLLIYAFPSNQFGNERRNFQQIKEYNSNFDAQIMAKIDLNGQYTSDLYKFLKKKSQLYNIDLSCGKPIQSDFCKFLINKEGKIWKFYDINKDFQQIQNDIEKLI